MPFVQGSGHVKRFPDGAKIILPKAIYRKTGTEPKHAVFWDQDGKVVDPPPWKARQKLRQRRTKEQWAAMRAITRDCVEGPEYFFQDGLRKVK